MSHVLGTVVGWMYIRINVFSCLDFHPKLHSLGSNPQPTMLAHLPSKRKPRRHHAVLRSLQSFNACKHNTRSHLSVWKSAHKVWFAPRCNLMLWHILHFYQLEKYLLQFIFTFAPPSYQYLKHVNKSLMYEAPQVAESWCLYVHLFSHYSASQHITHLCVHISACLEGQYT